MRNCTTIALNETVAPMLRQRPTTVWLKTLTTIALLAAAAGIAHAQVPDDAFLPSPVRSVSTVPANGDGNPYGVAFVPNNFLTGSGPLRH